MPVFRLTEDIIFPRPNLAEDNGLLAVGGDLSPARLIHAYRLGIFPWYSEGDPILWWFLTPRLVIYPERFHLPRRLARDMRKSPFSITFDEAFDDVIESCATMRTHHGQETWITSQMMEAYQRLHRLGYAHSVECWQGSQLVGGLYGVALDRVFFGESMFTAVSNASKIALVILTGYLRKRKFGLIDCQMTTDHLLQFGACQISGRQFSRHLNEYIKTLSPDGKWKNEPTNASDIM